MKHYPIYHFRPKDNWMNDPNGPIYYNGTYHMFYQYNPNGAQWGSIHWGHSTSKDMIHWTEAPIALTPALDRGETNCFSGTSFVNGDKIDLMYTSIGNMAEGKYCSSQWIAESEDFITWKPIADNPVISTEQSDAEGHFLSDWRDPFVFEYRGETLMVIAGVLDGWKKAIHIYRSSDKRHWEYMNVFYSEQIPTVFEVPNVIVMGDKVILLYTPLHGHVRYVVGTINEDYSLNVIRHGGEIDAGCYYATNVFQDDTGRNLLWGWLREDERSGILTDGKWSGALSLPRVVSLNERDELVLYPAREAELLRGSVETFEMNQFSGSHLFQYRGDSCEICCSSVGGDELVFRVLASEDGTEYTDISISPKRKLIRFIRACSSHIPEVIKTEINGRFGGYDQRMNVRIYVDRSIIEVYINDQFAYTARCYPTNTDGIVSLYTVNGQIDGHVELYDIPDPGTNTL